MGCTGSKLQHIDNANGIQRVNKDNPNGKHGANKDYNHHASKKEIPEKTVPNGTKDITMHDAMQTTTEASEISVKEITSEMILNDEGKDAACSEHGSEATDGDAAEQKHEEESEEPESPIQDAVSGELNIVEQTEAEQTEVEQNEAEMNEVEADEDMLKATVDIDDYNEDEQKTITMEGDREADTSHGRLENWEI
ncbi:hypothetical protein Btru_039966 [Bulinus truncatus]|nr:hypothetical protein Btru_039966 [Bulinus truncatus]